MRSRLWILAAVALLAGCTDQQRAKTWGGSATIDLPAGARVVTATWKEDDLWVLTRQDVNASSAPQTYLLTESSSFGLLQGRVALVEH